MFRSTPRFAVAVALVFAFLLSTVPAQAQPRDFGASFTLGASWLDTAVSWLRGLLGSGEDGLESRAADGKESDGDTEPGSAVRTGPCIDPSGAGCLGG